MKSKLLGLWVLMAALLGGGFAQTLVLTNGDVNGDNLIDDADQLAVIFAMGQSCPSGCPEDLDGNRVVDDADLLIVLLNFGAQGAETFAGQVQAPQGAFTVRLTLRLGDWVGGAQQVKVQLKPVGTERDANVPIYEYSASVGGNDTVVDLANLPAGVYTVRAFPASPGRWLRVEGKLLTEVPWLFAAPTGANKVTVYWDGVPGATGYRVRWRESNENDYPPGNVVVVGADVRQQSVARLEREQEYYFVVEAAYNGLWGPPSEEDSAVPHEGAIPWDTQDPNQIVPAIRAALGVYDGDISALSPDEWYYTETGWIRSRKVPLLQYETRTARVVTADGAYFMPMSAISDPQHRNRTGPFRRVETRQGLEALQVMGEFYLPPPRHPSMNTWYIWSEPATWGQTRDTPHVYFGIKYMGQNRREIDIEGGLAFHPAGRGLRVGNQERGGDRISPPPNYDRWNIFLNLGWKKEVKKIAGDFGEHLSYGVNWQDAPYGFIVWLMFGLVGDENKLVALHLHAWRFILEDPASDPPSYKRVVVGCAYKEEPVPPPQGTPQVRRIISIAQDEDHTRPNGWVRTRSFLLKCGVAYAPIFTGEALQELSVYLRPTGWQWWVENISNQPENFPTTLGVIRVEPPIARWYREVVNIDLR
jgi:hypothetical protein